jgi:hypothetical protein
MSDLPDDLSKVLGLDIRTPDMELADIGADMPNAADLALESLNPANPHLFKEDRWHDHFARLRAEDPVHFQRARDFGPLLVRDET